MKIKKVEISAFRIYDNPKDATFDLTTSSGNVADFVSLYAPNGYGKTSFYDAVEFGITESINRFFIRKEEAKKLADFQHNQNSIPFVRNTNSPNDRKTYVEIETDSISQPKIKRIFKKHGNQIHDLMFDRPVVHDFQKVILSQEWISAFLTEQKGEERYEKFMNTPELSVQNDYYKKVKLLYATCQNKREELNREISKLEASIKIVSSENILEKVNQQIQFLSVNYDQNLIPFTSESTQEDIKKFKDAITNQLPSDSHETELTQLISYISIAKSGDSSIIGAQKYFAAKEKLEKDKKTFSEICLTLGKFELLEKSKIEQINVKSSLQKHIEKRQLILKISSYYEDYEKIAVELKNKNDQITSSKSSLYEISKELDHLRRLSVDKTSSLTTIIAQIEEAVKKKEHVPQIKTEFERLEKLNKQSDQILDEKRKTLIQQEKECTKVSELISKTDSIIEGIKSGQYPQIFVDNDSTTQEWVRILEEKNRILNNEKELLKSQSLTIEQQTSHNEIIANFIKQGMSIVKKQHSSVCPLCEYTYDSYDSLVKKIANNNALDNILKGLLTQKASTEAHILELTTNINEIKSNLIIHYQKQLNSLQDNRSEINKQVESLKTEIEDIENVLSDYQSRKIDITVQLEGMSFDDFGTHMDKKIAEFTRTNDLLMSEISSVKERLDQAAGKTETLNNRIDLYLQEENRLKNDEKYVCVLQWFTEHMPNKIINKKDLIEMQAFLSETIAQYEQKHKEIEGNIASLLKELLAYDKAITLKEKNELEKRLNEYETALNKYLYFLKDNIDLDISKISNQQQLTDILAKKNETYENELRRIRCLREEYRKLDDYSNHIWPFLQSENAKNKLAEIRNELNTLENIVEPVIEHERENIKNQLNAKIKEFFHEDLINKLYRKIDPHPDFKSVEFKANFDSDNPRLDVFVRNTKNENTLIPNLYFSTAQINILSLSIFLATALNSKEYKCIFIDDPIQSMDSVNILSTIDLFRSIVVNQGKQIILSTHDKNFHNLLIKKMPPNLFESKFLELESFGKVK